MPNRIIKESICTSETINLLTPDLETFFYRLMVQCDDFGRMDARPSVIRSRCYPLRLNKVTDKQITLWVNKLAQVDLIKIYSTDSKYFLQITTWEKHQQIRAKRSKYPEPEIYCNQLIADDIKNTQAQNEAKLEESDSNGNQLIADDSICPRNPIQSNPNPIRNPNTVKSPYGEFQNVLLSETELEKLKIKFGEQEALERIKAFSESLQSHKDYQKKYTDHYATILTWARLEEKRNGVKNNGQQGQNRNESGGKVTGRTQGFTDEEYTRSLR
jgi:hypothetical protein